MFKSKKAVVLTSGGLDSSTVLAMAADQEFAIYSLSFDYGQRHVCELRAAEKVAAAAKARKIALGAAKKARVGKMEAAAAAEQGGVEKVEDGGVPGKSDMKASVKKPKRKKRMEEVEKDGEDGEEPDEERTTSGEEK